VENSKACSKCLQTLSVNSFHKKKSGRFGVAGICRYCQSAISRKWREENIDRKKLTDKNWQINNRERKRQSQKRWEAKNAEAERLRKASYYQENKQLWRKRGAAWAKANPEKENQKKRNWRKNNPEKNKSQQLRSASRIKENGIFTITKKEMSRLVSAKNCFYCNEVMDRVTIDHVIPRSRGGRHSIGNLVSCCGRCNSSKGAKTITEWHLRFRHE
jgi:5-methylcytosine-specific restriction endonuclease McrA